MSEHQTLSDSLVVVQPPAYPTQRAVGHPPPRALRTAPGTREADFLTSAAAWWPVQSRTVLFAPPPAPCLVAAGTSAVLLAALWTPDGRTIRKATAVTGMLIVRDAGRSGRQAVLFEDRGVGGRPVRPRPVDDQLSLEGGEERLGKRVVPALAGAADRETDAEVLGQAGEFTTGALAAAVGMKDHRT